MHITANVCLKAQVKLQSRNKQTEKWISMMRLSVQWHLKRDKTYHWGHSQWLRILHIMYIFPCSLFFQILSSCNIYIYIYEKQMQKLLTAAASAASSSQDQRGFFTTTSYNERLTASAFFGPHSFFFPFLNSVHNPGSFWASFGCEVLMRCRGGNPHVYSEGERHSVDSWAD